MQNQLSSNIFFVRSNFFEDIKTASSLKVHKCVYFSSIRSSAYHPFSSKFFSFFPSAFFSSFLSFHSSDGRKRIMQKVSKFNYQKKATSSAFPQVLFLDFFFQKDCFQKWPRHENDFMEFLCPTAFEQLI